LGNFPVLPRLWVSPFCFSEIPQMGLWSWSVPSFSSARHELQHLCYLPVT
jgi:hypothetical protein